MQTVPLPRGGGGVKTPKTQGEQGTQTNQVTDRKAARQQRRADRQANREAQKETKQQESNTAQQPVASDDTEYNNCKLDIRRKYTFTAEDNPRYQELYDAEEEKRNKEWEEKLDKPYEAGTDIKGQCNGVPYTCTAGQTPRQCKPRACWYLGRESDMALEHRIKEEFIQEMVDTECAKYKQ